MFTSGAPLPSRAALCAECSRLVDERFDVDTVAASEIVDAVARVECSGVEFFSEGDWQAFLTVDRDHDQPERPTDKIAAPVGPAARPHTRT